MGYITAPQTSGFKPAEYEGALLLVQVIGFESGIVTPYGVSDAIRADVVSIQGPMSQAPRNNNVLIFNRMIVGQLRSIVGQTTLGRLTRGLAKAGQSAPFVLAEPTQQDITVADQWIAANGDLTNPSAASGQQQAPPPPQYQQVQQQSTQQPPQPSPSQQQAPPPPHYQQPPQQPVVPQQYAQTYTQARSSSEPPPY
ncbi:MAG: hypothetical protein ACT4NY_09225 [Pseudonocardiales bacterium]